MPRKRGAFDLVERRLPGLPRVPASRSLEAGSLSAAHISQRPFFVSSYSSKCPPVSSVHLPFECALIPTQAIVLCSLAGASEQHPSSHVRALREPSTPRRDRPLQACAYIRAINLQALAELNVSAIDRLCQKRLVFQKRLALEQRQLPSRGARHRSRGVALFGCRLR